MKKVIIALGLLLLLAVGANAQGTKIAVFGTGGMGLPMSPEAFTDLWKMGPNFGGGIVDIDFVTDALKPKSVNSQQKPKTFFH